VSRELLVVGVTKTEGAGSKGAADPQEPLIELRGISKSFPGVKALDEVALSIFPGEVHALMGENGAGKSTLIKIINGVYQADAGEILMDGIPISVAGPVDAQRLGISYVPQEIGIEPFMTVADNIFLGRYPRGRFGVIGRRVLNTRASEILESLGLDLDPEAMADSLSIAEKQMITIGRAVSTSCKLIILDEATSSLTFAEIERLFSVINSLRQQGMAVIFVTHKMDELFALCDRVTIFRDGRLISTKMLADVTLTQIIKDMVGRQVVAHSPGTEMRSQMPRLELDGLAVPGVLDSISFDVYGGEIVGIAGLVGSGRTELARAIFGDLKISSGKIKVDGLVIDAKSPQSAIAAGIAMVPEDRKEEGLVLTHSVASNISGAVLRTFARAGVIWGSSERRLALDYTKRLAIRTPTIDQEVRFLSGGNQQRVVIAKWLATKPRVLIVDEPTRGVDVGAKAEIHALLTQLAGTNIAVVMISSELPEIIGVSNRVLVMYKGAIAGELEGSDITQERIMLLATGTSTESGNDHVEI
jgi:ABC-type sugar transport system ATPase subunit